MKQIFFLLLISQSLFSQEKPWEKLKVDSVTFLTAYGTEFQYNYQKDIQQKSDHKKLFLWTGAQYMYMFDFAYYLGDGQMNYNVKYDENSEAFIKIIATSKIYHSKEPFRIVTTAYTNKKGQITSATISGPPDDVLSIFIKYWSLSPISLNDLRLKKEVVKEFVSDRIGISLKGNLAVISVTKNKNASMDLFPLE